MDHLMDATPPHQSRYPSYHPTTTVKSKFYMQSQSS